MKEYNIANEIESKLLNFHEHPLNNSCLDYKQELIESLEEMNTRGFLNTTKKSKALMNRLQLSNNNINQYYQGISEIMFEFFSMKNNLEFVTEKKLRNDRNTDIDIQVIKNGYTFNFEIKTPEIRETAEGKLQVNTSFRSSSKSDLEQVKLFLETELIKPLLAQQSDYTDYEYSKINDNKILDYLKSAQEKVICSDSKTLNVLVLSLCTNEMQDYWDYLYNSFSGLFTDVTYDCHSNYDKVDVVLITNIVSGHQNGVTGAWDLKNYFNLFLPNPYCKKFSGNSWEGIYSELLDLIPNHTIEFDTFLMELEKEMIKLKTNLHGIIFPSFLNHYFPEFK